MKEITLESHARRVNKVLLFIFWAYFFVCIVLGMTITAPTSLISIESIPLIIFFRRHDYFNNLLCQKKYNDITGLIYVCQLWFRL